MIRLEVVVPFIGLNHKWSAAKVEGRGDHIVEDRKFFTSFGGNFYCNSYNIIYSDSDIHGWVKYLMTIFLKVTFYWEKAHDGYLTITNWR